MTDDHERPGPDDVEEYLNDIETNAWIVQDYSASYGRDDPVTVTVELEWSRPLPNKQHDVKRVLRDLEENHDEGAPVEVALDECEERLGITALQAEEMLEQLKERGEVYQPNREHLRVI